jgi:hypothetical protein
MLPVMWQNMMMHIMQFDAYYFTDGFRGDNGMLFIEIKLLREFSYSTLLCSFCFSFHALNSSYLHKIIKANINCGAGHSGRAV